MVLWHFLKFHLSKNNKMYREIRFVLAALLFCVSLGLSAQGNDQLISNTLGQDSTVSTNFVNGMSTTGRSLNCDPWDDDAPCTDLCDPWDDKTPCPNTSVMKAKIAASPKMQEAIIQSTMRHFEQAITNGKGGKHLTPKLVVRAKKKYPGKDIKALRSRFKAYIEQLKSSK